MCIEKDVNDYVTLQISCHYEITNSKEVEVLGKTIEWITSFNQPKIFLNNQVKS